MAVVKIEAAGDQRRTRVGVCTVRAAQLVPHQSRPFIQYLYDDLLERLAEDMHRTVENNFDNVVMVEGAEGSGKSNMIWNILNAYEPGFSISQSYVYNMDGIRDRFAEADYGGGLFWMDETSQIASNRTWQSRDNQDLVSILETSRSKGFTICGAIPSITRADIYLREHRMRYLVRCKPMKFNGHVYERGIFELYKRDMQSDKMRHVGYGFYKEMPKEAKEEYEPIKAEFQERFRKKIAEGVQREKGSKYESMYKEAQKKNVHIMRQLHDQKLVDDATIMDMFGFTNYRTYHNVLSQDRKRDEKT